MVSSENFLTNIKKRQFKNSTKTLNEQNTT